MLTPCNLTVKARKASEGQASGGESRAAEKEGGIDKEIETMLGCYTALEGRWSRGRCTSETISTCWPQDGSGRFRKAQKKMTDQQLALHCTSALPSPPHPFHPTKNHSCLSP